MTLHFLNSRAVETYVYDRLEQGAEAGSLLAAMAPHIDRHADDATATMLYTAIERAAEEAGDPLLQEAREA